MTERRACRLANQPRGTQRYRAIRREDEDALTQAIVQLASAHARRGQSRYFHARYRRGPLRFCYRAAMITLVRSWLLLLTAFICCDSTARGQHFNSEAAPCRNVSVTQAMDLCFDKAYRAADSGLNQTYSQISKVLQPDDLERLKVAQRLWIQFRDATCTAESDLYSGGTASAPAYSACLEEETRQRTADLKTTYGWVIANSK
jgi:uncharacterized protein YecT (DUF1311 family)